MKFFDNISHIGDIFAIPFFFLLIIYFHQIEHRNTTENILFLFSILGFVLDVFFTYLFVFHKKSK